MTEKHRRHLSEAVKRRYKYKRDNPNLYPAESRALAQRKHRWRLATNRLRRNLAKQAEYEAALRPPPLEQRLHERTGQYSTLYAHKVWLRENGRYPDGRKKSWRLLERERRELEYRLKQIEADRQILRNMVNPFGPQPESIREFWQRIKNQ